MSGGAFVREGVKVAVGGLTEGVKVRVGVLDGVVETTN